MELGFCMQGNQGPMAASLATGADYCAAKEHYACLIHGPSCRSGGRDRREPLHNLARMHQYGMGGPRDWDEAERLFLKAFDLGNLHSGHNLAIMVTNEWLQLQPKHQPNPKPNPNPTPMAHYKYSVPCKRECRVAAHQFFSKPLRCCGEGHVHVAGGR